MKQLLSRRLSSYSLDKLGRRVMSAAWTTGATKSVAAALAGFMASACFAAGKQTLPPHPEFALPHSQVINLPVTDKGIAYQLYVHVPPACGAEVRRCSVIYMLDAEYSFGLSALIVDHLADRDRIPPVISVAIGYSDKSHYHRDRTRDYTPYHFASGGYGPEMQRHSGGGDSFLEVVRGTILPYVQSHFPASSTERTLVGHSYGGLFATYVWMNAPELFENYIIVSPSLWYAEGRPLADLQRTCTEKPYDRTRNFFLAVGEYEEQPESGRLMVSDLKRMQQILKNCSGRRVVTHLRVFDGETHASVFPAALSTGIRSHLQ